MIEMILIETLQKISYVQFGQHIEKKLFPTEVTDNKLCIQGNVVASTSNETTTSN